MDVTGDPRAVLDELDELERRRNETALAQIEVAVDGLPAAVRRACDRVLDRPTEEPR